jgi:hypothetical protein
MYDDNMAVAGMFKVIRMVIAWTALAILAIGILLGIAATAVMGEDRPRPRDYFHKDAPPAALLQAQPHKSSRPKDYFQRDDLPAAPLPPDDPGPAIPQRKPNIQPAVPPTNMPSTHYRQTLTSVLSRAMTVYEDLPEGADADGVPAAAECVAYMPAWCVACWSDPKKEIINPTCPLNAIKADRRFNVTRIAKEELPQELWGPYTREELAYPMVYVPSIKRWFCKEFIATPDTLFAKIKEHDGAKLALTSPLNPDDAPVIGEIRINELRGTVFETLMDAATSLVATEKMQLQTTRAIPYEDGPFSASIPAGTRIHVSTPKAGGLLIEFPGSAKPSVKHTGFLRMSHAVQSVSINQKRVLVQCTWSSLWKQFCWEVR